MSICIFMNKCIQKFLLTTTYIVTDWYTESFDNCHHHFEIIIARASLLNWHMKNSTNYIRTYTQYTCTCMCMSTYRHLKFHSDLHISSETPCEYPLGQKSLEMAHEPRGVCLKLWVKRSRSCFLHSPRSHVRDVFGILNQTHVANSHSAYGQLFWLSGKCVFVQRVLKRIIQNTPRKGPVCGHMAIIFKQTRY